MHNPPVHKHNPKHAQKSKSGERCLPYEFLPLVVGVTGHRDYDPQNDEPLKKKVQEILYDLKKKYSHTEIILLSALAPGADRLTAGVAIECGISLYVPLPFPENDLPAEFVTDDDRAEFERLCGLAKRRFFVGPPRDKAPLIPLLKYPDIASGPEVEAQYSAAGAFVAAHCHILIALWDGKKDSQTARTLGYKRNGLPQKFAPGQSLLDPVDGGLWHHVYTPRRNTLQSDLVPSPYAPGEDVPHASVGEEQKVDSPLYRSIDEYNGYVEDLLRQPDAKEKLLASRETLIQAEDAVELSPALKRLRDAFAAADVLAIEFKQKAHRNFNILAFLVTWATAIFLIQADLPFFQVQEKPWLLLFACSILVGVRILRETWSHTRYRYQDKFQDYRALAEGLRVQFYWTLLGLPDSVADHYLRKQRSELEWIHRVFSIWNIYEGAGEEARRGMTAAQRNFRLERVRSRWVEEQEEFFTNKHRQNESGSHRTEVSEKKLLNLYMGLMAFCGLLLWCVHGLPRFGPVLDRSVAYVPALALMPEAQVYEMLHSLCILMIELPLIIAAVLHLRAEKFALTAQAKQYERMFHLFKRTSKHLAEFLGGNSPESLSNDVQVDELIRSLGREALAENADWVLMHRERLLEVTSPP